MPWSRKQKGILAMYRRYAGWSDEHYHEQLRTHTGHPSSTDHRLTQEDYDAFMPVVEIAGQLAETNGRAKGKPPFSPMNWTRWRDRRPPDGHVNSRQARMVWGLLSELGDIEGRPDKPLLYLAGILAKAHGGDWPASGSLTDLLAWQAALVIEALKDRILHARARKA